MPSLRNLRHQIHDWWLKHSRKPTSNRDPRKKTQSKSCMNLSSFPAELRSLILDEWLRLRPPEVETEGNGKLKHPLIDDTWDKLENGIFLNLFHAAPLVVKKDLGFHEVPSQAPLADWVDTTPQFLTLCDRYCGRLARKKIRFEVHFTITTRVDCSHRRVVIEPVRENQNTHWTATCSGLRRGAPCRGWCQFYAVAMWNTWCKEFMYREGLPIENARFAVTFVRERTLAKGLRWAKKHPGLAVLNVLGWTGLGVLLPAILVAVALYVIPCWMLWTVKAILISSKKYWLKTRIRLERIKGTVISQRYREDRRIVS